MEISICYWPRNYDVIVRKRIKYKKTNLFLFAATLPNYSHQCVLTG